MCDFANDLFTNNRSGRLVNWCLYGAKNRGYQRRALLPFMKNSCFNSWFASLLVFAALVSPANAGTVTAVFNSPSDPPVISASSYTATGNSISFQLNYAPTPGASLLVVENTGIDFISGTFTGLAQGQAVTLSYGGHDYPFVANYFGGTGNDLVLQWALNRVVAWGDRSSGELGDGSPADGTAEPTQITSPVDVLTTGALAGKTILAVAAGNYDSYALCSDGTIAAWGLGWGSSGQNISVPRALNWHGSRIVALAPGSGRPVALCADGTLILLGSGTSPGLGQPGAFLTLSNPNYFKKCVAVSGAVTNSLALFSDGTVMAWGDNTNGALGIGSTNNPAPPGLVNVSTTSSALTSKSVISIGAGYQHCFALCSDGSVAAWGEDRWGQLGDGNSMDNQVFWQTSPVSTLLNGGLTGRSVKVIGGGDEYSVALCTDGTLSGWGAGGPAYGGGVSNSLTPEPIVQTGVLAGKTVKTLSCGYEFVLAQCSDGTVVSWGDNTDGGLGNGTPDSSSQPVLVSTVGLGCGERFMIAGPGASAGRAHGLAVVAMPLPPVVTTSAATSVAGTTAVLNGVVNAVGNAAAVSFEYGLTTAYGRTAAATTVGGSADTPVSVQVTGLEPGTTYHFRALARGVAGADMTFNTFNVGLASLSTSLGTLSPTFDPATTTYDLNLPGSATSLTVTPAVLDATCTLKINGAAASSGTASGDIALDSNPTVITVLVTSHDTLVTESYTVTVSRGPSDNANLSSLAVSAGTLAPAFDPATTSYQVDVPNTTSSITVTPTVAESHATVKVSGVAVPSGTASGPLSLTVGQNTIPVLVTAQDGTHTRTYTLTVNRAPSSNADLSNLTVSTGTLQPVFSSGMTEYVVDVSNATTSLKVTATVAESHATVKVNGVAVASGSASGPLSLSVGGTVISVVVTAQNGTTSRTYHITVNRAPSSNSSLSRLKLSVGNLVPVFSPNKFNYTVLVAYPASSIIITPTLGDLTALVTVNGMSVGSGSGSGTIQLTPGINILVVVVTAQDGTKTTYTLTVTCTTKPTTGGASGSLMRYVGGSASFIRTWTGFPLPFLQWLRNNVPVAGRNTGLCTLPKVGLADGGRYTFKASNSVGSVISDGDELGVVDPAGSGQVVKVGGKATFTVKTGGNGLTYLWSKDGTPLSKNDPRYTGVDTKTLTIKTVRLQPTSDDGSYTCMVRGPGGSLEGGINTLIVVDTAPQVLPPDHVPPAIVSGTFHLPMTCSSDSNRTPTKYWATGLPPGITLDPITGVLNGRPNVAGTFVVTIWASNPAGNGPVLKVTIIIAPLPGNVLGNFNGLLERDTSLSAPVATPPGQKLRGHGGSLSNLVITSTGIFTGKLMLEDKTYLLPPGSRLDANVDADPTANVIILRGTAVDTIADLALSFTIDRDTGKLTGTLTDGLVGSTPIPLIAWRNPWTITGTPAVPAHPGTLLAGRYTAELGLDPALEGYAAHPEIPQGRGYVTLVLTPAGIATWGGKLADGTVVTASTTFGLNGDVPLHQMLYTPTVAATAGSLHGWAQVTPDSIGMSLNNGRPLLDGTLNWIKLPQASASTSRNYKAGFPLHELAVTGGLYVAPPSKTAVLSLTDHGPGTNDAKLVFSEGNLASTLNQPLRITNLNTVVMPSGVAANPAAVSLSLTAATGLVGGGFTLKDIDPTDITPPYAVVTRTVSWSGVLVPRLPRGTGFFLLPGLPANTTPKTTSLNSPMISGKVELKAGP